MAKNFVSITPTLEDYWRSIILFGRNTASYKFALANSLLHFGSNQNERIKAEDIASVFSRHICDHLKINDKQAVSNSNSYLDKCRQYNAALYPFSGLEAAKTHTELNRVWRDFNTVSQHALLIFPF